MNSIAEQAGPEKLYLQEEHLGGGLCLRLPVFEGPMDLLLYLIRREELDIFNIPIALITREYLQMLEIMRAYDLEVGGDFLSMAATLLQIKARMLLPRPGAQISGEEDDPRRELVERILEYKAYKDSAEVFRAWEAAQSEYFWKGPLPLPENAAPEEILKDVTLFDLLLAFKQAMDRLQAEKPLYNVFLPPETLDQRLEFLRAHLLLDKKISFRSLVLELETRLAIILTFLAILELVRIGEVALKGVGEQDFFLVARRAS